MLVQGLGHGDHACGEADHRRYHSLSHDMLYLEKWVDELIGLSLASVSGLVAPPAQGGHAAHPSSSSSSRTGSLDHFKEQGRRYNVCFKELIRKVTVIQPDLARLLAKAWSGMGSFVARLINDYEYQISKGSELEDKMKDMLETSQIKVFWNTKEMDKAKVNMALQRAHSIDLESAHEVLQKHSEQLQAENERLKHLISVFIEGMHDDDYEEAFPVPQLEPIPEEGEDGMSSGTHAGPDDLSHGSPRQGGSKSSSASTASPTPSSRKPSLLQASSPSSAPPLNSPLSASSVSYSCSLEGAMSPTVGSAGSQGRSSGSHEGQSKGANDARKLLSTEVLEARREKKAQSLAVQGDHMDRILHDLIGQGVKQEDFLNELEILIRTSDLTTLIASLGQSPARDHGECRSPRAPCPATSTNTQDSVVPSTTLAPGPPVTPSCDGSTQTDDWGLVQVNEAIFQADLAARRGKGRDLIPLELRPHMETFPQSMRIPSLRITTHTIIRMWLTKLLHDKAQDDKGLRRSTLPEFVPVHYRGIYGQAAVVDMQITQLVRALQFHKSHKRVQLFSKFIGIDDTSSHPPNNLRDLNFLMEAIKYLEISGEFNRAELYHDQDSVISLRRHKVVAMTEYLFSSFLPDGASAITRRMEAMVGPSDFQVDLDDVLEEVLREWEWVNGVWRGHLVYLFKRYCKNYTVVKELNFADDHGVAFQDALLVEVVERLDLENLRLALKRIDPGMDEYQIRAFYEEACETVMLKTKKELEKVWSCQRVAGGGRGVLFTNYLCKRSQCTPPYDLTQCRCHDMDMETFITLCLDKELLALGPFVSLLDKPSEDLWSNSDVYIQQVREGTIRLNNSHQEGGDTMSRQPPIPAASSASCRQFRLQAANCTRVKNESGLPRASSCSGVL